MSEPLTGIYRKEIADYIRSGEASSQNLGLEVEHFIIDEHGDQIDFDTISGLIARVGESLGARILY